MARVEPPGWIEPVCGQLAAQCADQIQPAFTRRNSQALLAALKRGKARHRVWIPRALGVHRAHEIRHEKQVEMTQVIGEVFGGGHQVDCQQAVVRRLYTGQPGQGAGGGDRLRHRADSADAWRVGQRIERCVLQQDLLEATVHGGVDPCRTHMTIFHVQLYFQIAFNPIKWADHQT